MDTLLAFVVAGVITLFFVRGYLKKLTAASATPGAKQQPSTAAAAREKNCPRCDKPMQENASFCPHCGAAMAMWTVHTAAVQAAAAGAQSGRTTPLINASMCIGCESCVHACPETGTLEMQGGKAILAHPDRCTGHAKCAEACPTQAITLSVGGVLQTTRVPLVDDKFETTIPGVFIVGELSGMGLIKTAINEGKLVIEHLKQRLAATPNDNASVYDVAIIGAGPAGLSASLAAHELGIPYLTLEQGEIAATIRQYPRQKFLMAEPLRMPLYGTLYIADSTKEALLSVWETIISNTGVRINTNERVESVQMEGSSFRILTPKGEYHARYVVLAMGKRGTPRKLNVAGEDLAKVSYKLIEAGTYSDSDVLVVGGGDSAIEAAMALSRGDSNRVTLCHRRASFDRARDRNREQLEQARKTGRIRVLVNAEVQRIMPEHVIVRSGAEELCIPNDYVFIMIGGQTPEEFLLKTGVKIVEKSIGVSAFA